MKKLLFCAGILALAASCTEEFDTASIQQEQAKGISFTEVADVQVPTTKGEFEVETLPNGEQWQPFWTAEKDKINVYAIKVTKDPEGSPAQWDGAAFDTDNKVTYKATRSERYAYFTSANTTDLLDFAAGVDATNPASFLATYPTGVVLAADATPDWTNGFSFKLTLPALAVAQTQTNTEGKGIYEYNAKYAVAKGSPKSDREEAVGESVALRFNRVLSGMVFRTENVDQYTSTTNNLFGKLKSVKLTTLGEGTVEDNVFTAAAGTPKTASKLTNGVSATVAVKVAADGTSAIDAENTNYDTSIGATAVTVNLGDASANGLEWKDENRVYMVLAPVSRVDDAGHAWTEGYSIDYTFEHIDFHVVKSTSNPWPAGGFGAMAPLDIDSYPYLVTKNRRGENTRALIVNSGNFSDILVEDAATPTVDWTDSETTTNRHQPYLTEFSTIIVNEGVTLTEQELGMLKQFTNLKEITLAENEKIPAETFNQQLTKINFPKVTEIVKGAFGTEDRNGDGLVNNAAELTTVLLPSYKFENAEIARSFLNPNRLTTLDMSAVPAMNVGFPSTGFTLDGYKVLKTIYVQDGIDLGANAFYGCEQLVNVVKKNAEGEDVPAVVNLAGTSVFNGCKALLTVNIENTEIPANSFKDCEQLVNVKVNNEQVKPTSVGISAFENCKALVNMDLSNVKEVVKDGENKQIASVGANAFKGCEKLIGVTRAEDGKIIIQVGGQIIGANAFDGCTDLVHIEFLNATEIGDRAVNISGGDLKQIQLDKVVTFIGKNTDSPFANNMSAVDLFITPGQGGVDGNELYWSNTKKVVFKSIRDKAE